MIALTSLPMFGFVVLAFLLLCTILSFAVWFATRGTVDPGRTRISGPAGCAIGCALLAVTGLGAIATLTVVIVNLPAEWARRGPIERLALHYGNEHDADSELEHATRDTDVPSPTSIHAEIELRPGYEPGPILRVLRRKISSDLDVSVRTVERDGETRTLIEVDVPLDDKARRELRQTLRELREELPELELPSGMVLEIRGPKD